MSSDSLIPLNKTKSSLCKSSSQEMHKGHNPPTKRAKATSFIQAFHVTYTTVMSLMLQDKAVLEIPQGMLTDKQIDVTS